MLRFQQGAAGQSKTASACNDRYSLWFPLAPSFCALLTVFYPESGHYVRTCTGNAGMAIDSHPCDNLSAVVVHLCKRMETINIIHNTSRNVSR